MNPITREIKFQVYSRQTKEIYPVTSISINALGTGWLVYWGKLVGLAGKDCDLLEYTGLKDKKGVEIYEGDVVKWQQASGCLLPPDPKAYTCVIEWGWDHSWRCKYVPKDTCFTFASSHIDVIGNIYENPELAKETN